MIVGTVIGYVGYLVAFNYTEGAKIHGLIGQAMISPLYISCTTLCVTICFVWDYLVFSYYHVYDMD